MAKKKEGKTAKGRSNDPLNGQTVFIKVPTPDGYAKPYTEVPTDPLKLHMGVLTSMFAYDKEDIRVTGAHTLKQVLGLEHVVRPYVDTTEIASILRDETQRLAFELIGDHGDVGEHIIELLGVFEQELPQLFDMLGQGAMDTAEKVAYALVGKMRNVSLRIASQLSINEQTIAGMTDSVQRTQDTLRNLDETRLQIYKNWAHAVHVINDAVAKIQELFRGMDDAILQVRDKRTQLDQTCNTQDGEFLSAASYIDERDGEFQCVAAAYSKDPLCVPDIKEHIVRAQTAMETLQKHEQEVQRAWTELKNTVILENAVASTKMNNLKTYLETGIINFGSLSKQLGADAVKPYELKEDEVLCTQKEFEEAEGWSKSPEWQGEGCQNVCDSKMQTLDILVHDEGPQLPSDIRNSMDFARVLISQIQSRLRDQGVFTPAKPPSVSKSPSISSQGEDFDAEIVEYAYEQVCCVAGVLTGDPDGKRARHIHKMLHIAVKLPQNQGILQEQDVPLLLKPLQDRSKAPGERGDAVRLENVSTAWEQSKGIRWIHFQNEKHAWCLKLAKCAMPDALRLMEKYGITEEQIRSASSAVEREKRDIGKETGYTQHCPCYRYSSSSDNSK